MRKVKVLALLLAALMVVAVFAGCADTDAIVADVDSLEDRVTALEGLLNDQKDAIDDVKDQIGDVSDKLDDDTTADQLAATLEALKQLQEAMNAQNEQIKDLADKVTKVEEDAKESDENADDDAALQAAVKVYTAQLQELKITCELSKDDYVLADYEAVVKALSDGIVAVAAAEKADDAKAAFEAAKAVYDAKATVYTKLINYYNAVLNAITVDSKDLIAEINAYINDKDSNNKSVVNAKYPNGLPEKIAAYATGKTNADGTAEKINLVNALNEAIAAYNYLVSATGFKAAVTAAMANIKAIGDVKLNNVAVITTAQTSYKTVVDNVTGNTVNAKYLADSNLDSVENAAVLTAAVARLNQLTIAQAMYTTLRTPSEGKMVSVFDKYVKLTTKVDYTKKAVYDEINAALQAWINTYALDEYNIAYIIDNAEASVVYATYKAENHKVNLFAKAYTDFAAIANRVLALNKVAALDSAAFTEYEAIAKAIDSWKVVQKEDKTVTPNIAKISVDEYNMALIFVAYGLVNNAADATIVATDLRTKIDFTATLDAAKFAALKLDKDNSYFGLYCFADEKTNTFFATTYATAKKEAGFINANISTLKGNLTGSSKYTDIKRHLAVEGVYELVDGYYVKKTVSTTDYCTTFGSKVDRDGDTKKEEYALTIAAFKKLYVTDDYDLSGLLKLEDFDAALQGAIDRIAGYKSGAANIKKLVDDVDYVALVKVEPASGTWSVTASDAYRAAVETDYATGKVIYYVNLNDVAAVAAANAAYTAWINSGATSQLQEWIPALDEDGEVMVDANGETKYEFAPIADAEALRALKQMSEDIAKLQSAAAKVVAHFELVAEIWNQNKTFALNATAEENTVNKDVLDLVPARVDAGMLGNPKVPHAYRVVLTNDKNVAAAYSFAFDGTTYYLAYKEATPVEVEKVGTVATLQDLIDAGYNAYQAFLSMNAEIKLKTSNGALVLDSVKAVKDSSVENAIKGIAAAELVMVKDKAMDDVRKNITDTITADYYCNWINGVTSLNDLTGNSLWTVAQEIYAKSNKTLKIASYTRGAEIKVWGKSISDYTQVFRAPVYDNLG